MPRDPRYDVLFEPVRIGPVTAKNRFFQVPHCNGLGFRDPTAMTAMREVKAEGGWGVVCTEQADIHHTSEITPFIELRLWDDRDMPMLARVAERVHTHSALAGIELTHNSAASNLFREVAGAVAQPLKYGHPHQARMMTRHPRIPALQHRAAALRAAQASTSSTCMPRTTCPAGALPAEGAQSAHGRIRRLARKSQPPLRELIEDTKDAIGDRCAVAVRFASGDLPGATDDSISEARASCTCSPTCRTCGHHRRRVAPGFGHLRFAPEARRSRSSAG
jgi:dimethylamine/trimethylamine dehydrogenase